MRQAMIDTVDEVGRVSIAEGIDCDFVKGGNGEPRSRRAAQLAAARAEVDDAGRWESTISDEGCRPQPAGQPQMLGSTFDPACARLRNQVAARAVERLR
jgi:hypothetical protein